MQKITPAGEALWPAVFKPTASLNEEKGDEFQLSIMWDHDDEDLLEPLREAILEVATEKFGKKAEQMLEKGQLNNPLRDGDDTDQDYLDGKFFMTARSTDRPDVVDEDMEDLIDTKEFYGGCEARMDVWLYAYDKKGNKGVAAILNNVQKTGEGERKGGRRRAKDAFDDGTTSGKKAKGKTSGKKKSSKKLKKGKDK